jgi:hypothetical protein
VIGVLLAALLYRIPRLVLKRLAGELIAFAAFSPDGSCCGKST